MTKGILLTDLDGVNIARGSVYAESIQLDLCAPSGFHSSGYYPAESITLGSLDAIAKLHAMLEDMLETYGKLQEAGK